MKKSTLATVAGFTSATVIGAGMLLYGALVESNSLVLEKRTLWLKGWPERLNGYRIAVLADFHLRNHAWSINQVRNSVAMALDADPDMIALTGDFVAFWQHESPKLLGEALEPLLLMNGNVVAVPGNHDYWKGDPEILDSVLEELNVRLLRNESWKHEGITWVGVDSAAAHQDNVAKAMQHVQGPAVCLWHEPDMVDQLPEGCALMLSGHSHGGQFRFPGGFTPMHTRLGQKYPRGYYPDAPIPLYVSRGIGTTGPPSRYNCAPEVTILTLVSA